MKVLLSRSSLAIIVASAALAGCGSTPASSAGFYTYGSWDALPDGSRATYVAGTLDALINFSPDERTHDHYSSCLGQADLSAGQIAGNLRAFAQANPQFQRGSVQRAMFNYLFKLCGKAPE